MKQDSENFWAMNSIYKNVREIDQKLELCTEMNILNNFELGAVRSKDLETLSNKFCVWRGGALGKWEAWA